MESAVIVYGSVTGLTEEVAYTLGDEIKNKYDTSVINAVDFDPQILRDADVIILGSSTWGVGELQMDMIPVNESLQNLNLEAKKAAVFGMGDSAYKRYCHAVSTLEKSLESSGAKLIQKSFRCNKDFDGEAKAKLKEWASNL